MNMSSLLENLLAMCEEFEASDLHLSVGFAPHFRIRGALVAKRDFRPSDSETVNVFPVPVRFASAASAA